MKIGIMSMQRVVNCGSFLQAYGLKKIIESLGHEVCFVDYKVCKPCYRNPGDRAAYLKNRIKKAALNILSSIPFLFPIFPEEIRYSVEDVRAYHKDYYKRLGVTKRKVYHKEVDTLVIGSDEVFNCLQLNPEVGFSPELFGKNHCAKKVITYAASFGNTIYEEIEAAGKKDELESYFNNIYALSVRDKNSAEIIQKISGKTPVHNLDPVLIYGFNDEIPDINIKEDYVLVYAYRRRIRPDEAEVICAFAKEEGLRVISVGGYQPFCDENILVSPFEVLGYFKKARFVFTDTFHGTIFSIINHKQFLSFVRESTGNIYGNSEKMNGLLEDLGLLDRRVSDSEQLFLKIQNKIDYSIVDQILEKERISAKNYLKGNL